MRGYKSLVIGSLINRSAGGRFPRIGVSLIGALVVAVLIGFLGYYLDRENAAANQIALGEQIERDARLVQGSISRQLHADLASAEFLTDLISANPDLDLSLLQRIADNQLRRNRHFVSVTLAPDFKIAVTRFANPEAAAAANGSGLGFRTLPAMSSALLARDGKGRITLSLPVETNKANGLRMWGAVVFAIDEARFLQRIGLKTQSEAASGAALLGLDYLDIGIAELGGSSPNGIFFGTGDFGDRQSVSKLVSYPGGAWEVRVAPKEGWRPPAEGRFPFRLVAVIAAISMILPIFIASLLIGERNRNISELRRREEKLIEVSKRLNLAIETSNIGIWEFDEARHALHWDTRAAELHGRADAAETADRMVEWLAVIHPADRDEAEAHFFQYACFDTSGTSELVYRIIGEDGDVRYLRSVGSYSGTTPGQGRIVGIVSDITADRLFAQTLRDAKETSDIKNAELELALDELSSREHELSELSHKFDLALASYNCGIWEADPDTLATFWDERMYQLYGLTFKPQMLSQQEWLSAIHPEDRAGVREAMKRAIASRSAMEMNYRVQLPSGAVRYVRSVGQLHKGRDGVHKIIGIAFDITADMLMTEQLKAAKQEAEARNLELELAKNRIEYNALHDPLTSLANRRKFDMELDELSRLGREKRLRFSILHLDLDRFKEINDTLGHAAGDAMLVNASKVLARNVRAGDLVARIGGDEFVILAKRNTETSELAELCERIIEQMGQPIDFEGFSCRCGVSIGIAQAQGAQADARKVLINADLALYEAKERGRNCYEFFSENLQSNIISTKRMADEILAGLENDQFTAWYQPQFDARTMELSGIEALVRWNHPTRGVLASGTFLKIAEDLNVVARLDQLVLEKTLRDRMLWAARGLVVPKVSVNVSSRRLHDKSLIGHLEGLSLEPGALAFELVESIFLDESDDVATTNIDQIKAMGIDVEIDDFGTGHTSIVSLLKLKPKRLKIDRQLVMPIINSPQERTLVRSIIDIARSLGVETVAEGVETNAHALLLRELGCDYLQGYAFAKPLPSEDFYRFVVRQEWRAAS